MIVFSVGLCLSGLTLGFVRGWSLALGIFAMCPVLGTTMGILFSRLMAGAEISLEAYGQSAGYAEQALSAVKIVCAFGMEAVELRSYSKYLENARQSGIKFALEATVILGVIFTVIYCAYAYAFWLGGVYIFRGIENGD